jgi:hypothetical protein
MMEGETDEQTTNAIGGSMPRYAMKWGLRCLDLRGRQCWDRPDIGAYYSSSGDPTPTRNAR